MVKLLAPRLGGKLSDNFPDGAFGQLDVPFVPQFSPDPSWTVSRCNSQLNNLCSHLVASFSRGMMRCPWLIDEAVHVATTESVTLEPFVECLSADADACTGLPGISRHLILPEPIKF